MAPHSSTLAWKIPWTEEPGRLLSMGSQRVRHDWVTSLSLFTFMHCTSGYPAAAAKSLQSCPTLCDPIDDSPPGSPIPGILQARTLEWFVTSFSSAGKWKAKVKSLSHVRLFATPWTDSSPPGSSIHGIFQARVLEWGAIAFSAPRALAPCFSTFLEIFLTNLSGVVLFRSGAKISFWHLHRFFPGWVICFFIARVYFHFANVLS